MFLPATTAPVAHAAPRDPSSYTNDAVQIGIHVVAALLVFLIGLWVARRLANAVYAAFGRSQMDTTLSEFLRNLLYGVLVALLIVTALGVLGVPSAPMVAALGTAGLAVGLALQGSLSNLAWGVLLILFRPFAIGDYVVAGGIEGTVQGINLMHTLLLLPDGRESIVPNGKIGSDAITNFNRRGTRRFELTVGIGYEDDIGEAMAQIGQLFAADERILKDPAPGVWTGALGDSSVDLIVRGWTRTPDIWATKAALLRAIKERFDQVGINMPYPQRELRVLQGHAVQAAAVPDAPKVG